jgi:hypothetical protein
MAGEVVGREQELAAVGQFLEGHGLPSILLIEGEAGIGKTTLWRAVRNRKPNRRRRQPILSKPCFSPPATTRRASRAQARFNVSSCSSLVHVEAALRHLLVHLVVAYQGQKGKTRYNDPTVRDEIRVVRGDARGAGRFGRAPSRRAGRPRTSARDRPVRTSTGRSFQAVWSRSRRFSSSPATASRRSSAPSSPSVHEPCRQAVVFSGD